MIDERGNTVKDYFLPGDLVTLKQDVPDKPIMIVKGKDTRNIKSSTGMLTHLRGIKCFWFSKDLVLQVAVFNTKDLKHVVDVK